MLVLLELPIPVFTIQRHSMETSTNGIPNPTPRPAPILTVCLEQLQALVLADGELEWLFFSDELVVDSIN
jgi:hypothetical protein